MLQPFEHYLGVQLWVFCINIVSSCAYSRYFVHCYMESNYLSPYISINDLNDRIDIYSIRFLGNPSLFGCTQLRQTLTSRSMPNSSVP